MAGLGDLLRGAALVDTPGDSPAVMVGQVADVTPLRALVPAVDGGAHALSVFGTLPDGAGEGDPVRVSYDETGGLVLVAWEPA
ncbi:MAG: hypothetical protein PGN13_16045 [Patulibacter minatonensis]